MKTMMISQTAVRFVLSIRTKFSVWTGKLLGDVAAVSAMLDRLLHHGHVLKCGPRSWRTKAASGG